MVGGSRGVRLRGVRLIAALAVSVLVLTVPAAGADDLEAARQRRAELQQRLDQAAQDLAQLEARAAELDAERSALEGELAGLRDAIAAADSRVAERARTIYKRGNVDPVMALFTSEEPQTALDRAAVVVSLVRDDRATSEQAAAQRDVAAAIGARLEENRSALDAALEEQRAVSATLQQDLEEAAALERRLEEEARRRAEEEARRRAEEEARRRAEQEARRQAEEAARRSAAAQSSSAQGSSSGQGPTTSSAPAPVAAPSGGYTCPIGTPRSYTDTWGAPRSGGRRHQGTDILAPRGTPIYAVTSGVVDNRGYGRSAGNWIIFRGDDGDQYWYMHLDSFAVGDGAHVSAGTVIGRNGDTGNARGTPHLHFERHPGGGSAVNPYPFVRSVCG